MQARPEFAPFGVTDPRRLAPYLERRSFAQGECIIRQGTAGGECYLIEEGEVRLEVERLDFDSNGVIAYLQAGMLCGEFSFLDGRPRSASAYAHTDVVASRLSAERLQELCGNDPQTGLAVLRALGQDAATKARQTSQHLEEFIFSDQLDPSVDRMVAAAAAAQAAFAGWPEARVEALLEGIAQAAATQAEELAAATVAETGIGNVADKTFKNRFASLEVYRTLQGKPGVGPRPTNERGVSVTTGHERRLTVTTLALRTVRADHWVDTCGHSRTPNPSHSYAVGPTWSRAQDTRAGEGDLLDVGVARYLGIRCARRAAHRAPRRPSQALRETRPASCASRGLGEP